MQQVCVSIKYIFNWMREVKEIIGKIWSFIKRISVPDVIFVIAIAIFIIIPNTKFDKDEYDFVEKRPLGVLPKLIKDNGEVNKEFGKQFENFYNDRFRKRTVCIDANLYLKGLINRRMENSLEMEGLDNWIFYKGDNSIANYQNKVLFSDMELLKIKRNLDLLNNWCRKNNIKLIVVIPPDKNRIYGEYYPRHIKKVNPKSRVELLREYMDKNSNVKIIYPVEQMYVRKKLDNEPLYYYTDTHWTPVGAYIAYSEILKQIKQKYSYVEPVDYNMFETKRMTFKEMFGRDGDGAHNLKIEDSDFKYLYFDKLLKDCKPRRYNLKVAVIGDSFSGELSKWLKNNFNIKYYWYNEKVELFDNFSMAMWEDKILSYKPDVLVVEFLERYAYKLLDLYKD